MSEIAIITGGNRGLGRDIALNLAKQGKDILLTYNLGEESAKNVIDEINKLGQKAAMLKLDVSDLSSATGLKDQVELTLKAHFKSDTFKYLINNAGIGIHATFHETTTDQFDQLMNIHLKSPFFITQSLLTLIEDHGGIVNISTGLTRFSLPGYAAYASMKGAMEILTKYQAKELGSRDIRSNIVAPGAIETDFGGGVVRDNPEVNRFISSQTALGRTGRPDDIGSVVAFLCSSAAKWITGQRIEVSGGMFI